MSIIKSYGFVNHFHGSPTTFVVHLRGGKPLHQGAAQAFWFSPRGDALSEVPLTDQELPVLFHAYTLDHQDVSVQVTLTYRFTDPVLAAQRLDFGVFPHRADDAEDARAHAAAVLTRQAQSVVVADIVGRALEAVVGDIAATRAKLAATFEADERLRQMGIAVIDVQVLAIRPSADVEKALQTPLREQIQAEADKATYERRALAVEREQTISENELASKLELATRTEQLVAQEGTNARRKAEEDAAAALVKARSDAEAALVKARSDADGERLAAEAVAEAIRTKGEAEAASTDALMRAYTDVDRDVLRGLALRDLAQGMPSMNMGDITITPDLLTKVLEQLGASLSQGRS